MDTRSRVASAMISAHETIPGQMSSSLVLVRMMTSKASPGRALLISWSRSAVEVKGLELRRREASQPPTTQSWKKRRRVPAAVEGTASCLSTTVSWTILAKLGQVLS
ncbi:hypothetical protein ACJIZ3_020243 [Penstemon smallii]|uniref:Uncharacterized protein n=1 Tax=Penstemon smallii TaxID=265156 RepID=A0ABD3SI17_9LAMI